MDNKLQTTNIKSLMANDAVKAKFNEILGKNANAFISSVVTLSTTTKLAECEPKSVLSAAIVAATLNLQINPNLGFAAIIPYNSREGKVAQFQVMAKGFLQLALRSGQFETINVIEVYTGEIKSVDKLTGEIDLTGEKKNNTVIGYCAYFRLLNGFSKTLYMTVEDINAHAKKFSKTYSYSNGVWSTNYDAMAKKTVLKLLLSRYAPLSVEMDTAVLADQATIVSNDEEALDFSTFEYVDNDVEIDEAESAKKAESASKVINTIEQELTSKKQSELFTEKGKK